MTKEKGIELLNYFRENDTIKEMFSKANSGVVKELDELAEMCIVALENIDYYKWHDRTKDINDVPIVNEPTWVQICVMNEGIKTYTEALFTSDTDIKDSFKFIIGWKYIEPFIEVK